MWVLTTFGMFSVVAEKETITRGKVSFTRASPDERVIRARTLESMVTLIRVVPLLDGREIHEIPGRDYAFRIFVTKVELMLVMSHLAEAIDYSNFKDAAKERAKDIPERKGYLDLLHKVWGLGNALQQALHPGSGLYGSWFDHEQTPRADKGRKNRRKRKIVLDASPSDDADFGLEPVLL